MTFNPKIFHNFEDGVTEEREKNTRKEKKDDLIIGNVAPGDGQNKKLNLFISATMRTMSLLKVINILFDKKKKRVKKAAKGK